MELPPLTPATLLRRYKRFLADVRLEDGTEVVAHLPNPGRMTSCLRAEGGTPVLLSPGRARLPWTVELAMPGESWVLVNPGRANRVVGEAIADGRIPELAGWPTARAEQRYGERSRVDWLLSDGERRFYVEVKGVTLVRDGVAAFPDAVTSRGARHLAELAARVAAGDRAALVFCVGRGDAREVIPADDVDPAYGRALRAAAAAGVALIAWEADVTPSRIVLRRPLPVRLPG